MGGGGGGQGWGRLRSLESGSVEFLGINEVRKTILRIIRVKILLGTHLPICTAFRRNCVLRQISLAYFKP